MPTADSAPPIFYILFGIFLALVGIHFWRYLRRRFSMHSSDDAHAKTFTVRLIDEAPPLKRLSGAGSGIP